MKSSLLLRCLWAAAVVTLLSMSGAIASPSVATVDRPGYRVFVSNEASGTLSVIDGPGRSVTATLRVGKRPRGLAFDQTRRRLYVALSGSPIAGPSAEGRTLPPPDKQADGIAVIDVDRIRVVETFAGVSDPEQIAISPDGRRLYVASEDTGFGVMLDSVSGRELARVWIGGEVEGIGVAPDGRTALFTSEQAGTAVFIDASTLRVIARVQVGLRPRGVQFSADGSLVYVTCENESAVVVLDVHDRRVIHRIVLPGDRMRPMGMALSPDGSRLHVSTGRGQMVAEIDTKTHSMIRLIEVGDRPWGLALSPDGKWLYTANGPSNDVSIVDTRRNTAVANVTVESHPWGVIIVPQH